MFQDSSTSDLKMVILLLRTASSPADEAVLQNAESQNKICDFRNFRPACHLSVCFYESLLRIPVKLDLFTNATVVDDAIRFVSDKQESLQKNKSKSELAEQL